MTVQASGAGPVRLSARCFALGCTGSALYFLFNNYLIFWRDWPGALRWLEGQWGAQPPLTEVLSTLGLLQALLLVLLWVGIVMYVFRTPQKSLQTESEQLSSFAAFLCRGAFWAVFLIGLVDMSISFLRVEDALVPLIGEEGARELGRSNFRGTFLHYPLLVLGYVIALRHKGLGFTWFALLVVVVEFLIVLSRFVFSYEQAFMGDLVRMWYASLFLFASANALVTEGHVRVDVFYTSMRPRNKALSNTVGAVVLGMPLCWVILLIGMWDKGSSINSPLRSFEISQQGFGMYIKYLMVGFLVIFALTMLIQFCSYFLENLGRLLERQEEANLESTHQTISSSPA